MPALARSECVQHEARDLAGVFQVRLVRHPGQLILGRRSTFRPDRCLTRALTGSGPDDRRDSTMAAENKAANKVTEVKGKIKKKTGRATGDTSLEAEGRAEESKGDLKQAAEKAKDAFKKYSTSRAGSSWEPARECSGSSVTCS